MYSYQSEGGGANIAAMGLAYVVRSSGETSQS